ncbi:hypothetical protein BDB00DRAFT_597374 [Zychaea mexicana]|uniref:uncharacterized protein n=1 Tax=Zychaea mexicana TaxID=64656 RepID=UPI0022FE9A0E|nr:uncharacterized protein BDB00DRAFT_597374 [Zychaea mexicana]KAI9489741.1 hypothetical protein BDB00DRAFT_597374 [Zychaea mexicana]
MYNRVNTKIFTKPFRRRRHRQDDTIIETVTTTTTASPTQPFLRWAQEAVVTASDALIPDILLLQLSQAAKQKIEQRVAQRLIVKDPTSVKGYLASAKVHRAQGNIRAALKVYEEGLQHVSPNNPQHTDLENKRRETRSALVYYNHRFQQLLPYELLVLIFQDLEFMDMLRCAQACQAWAEFVVAWLPFWEKVPTYIPSCPEVIHASPLIPLMCRHQIRVLHLEGPMHIDVLCELLTFLTDSDSCPSIQELCKCV